MNWSPRIAPRWPLIRRWLLWPPSALRLRLTLWSLLVCAVALALVGALLLRQQQAALRNSLDGQLEATAQQALLQQDTGGSAQSPHQNRAPSVEVGSPVGSGAGITVAVAHPDRQGRIRLQNWTLVSHGAVPLAGKTRSVFLGGKAPRLVPTCTTSGGWRVCTVLAHDQHGRLTGAAQAAASLALLQPALDEMRTWLLVALPLALILITAGGWLLIGRALAPIDRITRTAAAIGAGNLSGRLGTLARNDEVGRLAATFDRMLDRLEGAFAQQRAFAAAASHELRTPLTIVKSDLDVLRRGHPLPPEEAEVLSGVDEEIARMGRTVEDLLTLARTDSGQDELLSELVAFDVLVGRAVADMERVAEEKGIALEAELAPDVEVVGDRSRLRQLVLNLLTNAVTYTSAGGSIRVRLVRDEEQARLTVADTSIGIAPDDLPHIFESFYRADKARSRAAGGSGLGLAIAHWCAQVHGGSIQVESRLGVGRTFTVCLPLAPMEEDPDMTPTEGLASTLHT